MQTITLTLSKDVELKYRPEGRLVPKELAGYLVGFTVIPVALVESITDMRKIRFHGSYEISQAKDYTVLKRGGKNILVFRTKDISGINCTGMPKKKLEIRPRPRLFLVGR